VYLANVVVNWAKVSVVLDDDGHRLALGESRSDGRASYRRQDGREDLRPGLWYFLDEDDLFFFRGEGARLDGGGPGQLRQGDRRAHEAGPADRRRSDGSDGRELLLRADRGDGWPLLDHRWPDDCWVDGRALLLLGSDRCD
jgi:hypothetical protein